MSNLPPMPDKSYLGDDVSWGYDAYDMRDYAEEAVRLEREAIASMFDNVTQIRRFGVEIAAAIRARSQEGQGAIK